MHSQIITLNLISQIEVYSWGPETLAPEERVYLLLHGFNERAKTSLRRFASVLPTSAKVLAPHGPYPLPERREDHWRVGYAWYFYDSFKEEYLITPDIPAQLLAAIIAKLAPTNPITVIGYSQGAYLAPYLPLYLENCDHVILCNGVVRSDLVAPKVHVRYDALNSTADKLVNFERARDHFQKFATNSEHFHFHSIETDSHELTPDHHLVLRQLLTF